MLPGKTNTVTIEHMAQSRDAHGAKVDGAVDSTTTEDAVIGRASAGNLWKISVSGNYSSIALGPSEWRITDNLGRVFNVAKVTYRPPIERLGESEHTLIFAEQVGEVDTPGVT